MGVRSLSAVAYACAVLAVWTAPADAARARTYSAKLGTHSMLYLNHTPVQQEALFRATADAGVRYLRMDFGVGIAFAWDRTDLSPVERIDRLATRYGIRVVGVITDTPWYIADCHGGATAMPVNCPPAPAYASRWQAMVRAIVAHAPHVRYWELGNEPDNGFGFTGSPADYARWATLTAAAIRAAQPGAKLLIGGLSRVDPRYIQAVLHDRANPLAGRFDIANVHLRGSASRMGSAVRRARKAYRQSGFRGPLWVTETGYPSASGESAQATWITRGVRAMADAGAGAVLVTLRDGPEFGAASAFASEGLVRWPQLTAGGRAYPKPSFWALKALAATRMPTG